MYAYRLAPTRSCTVLIYNRTSISMTSLLPSGILRLPRVAFLPRAGNSAQGPLGLMINPRTTCKRVCVVTSSFNADCNIVTYTGDMALGIRSLTMMPMSFLFHHSNGSRSFLPTTVPRSTRMGAVALM